MGVMCDFISDMERQEKTENRQSEWPASGQPHRMAISRTTVAYWRNKVDKVIGRDGHESPNYSARIGYQKRRMRFPLSTSNKEAAAQKAAKIFSCLLEFGWDSTLEKYKPYVVNKESGQPNTVGALIKSSRKYSTVRSQTFRAYEQAFRKIVADIMKVSGDKKYVTVAGDGNKKWKEAVDAVALSEITPVKIQAWRQARINGAVKDAASKRKATVTANSQIRNAKALFSKKLMPFIKEDVDLPSPLPFEDVQPEKVGSLRYHSRIDAKKLMDSAEVELKDSHPESYKVFLLALVCGLRVSEIDHLLWESIDLDECTLHVRNSEYHQLKSDDSEGVIDLGESVCSYLKQSVTDAKDDFVIAVSAGDELAPSAPYRCQKHLDFLREWLRLKGVDVQKPIHTLRKEVGSIIASEQGIFAASRYLRHADIQVTAAYYADTKKKIIPSIGG
jgi:integrase